MAQVKNYCVSLIVDDSRKVHYLLRSTSKVKAIDKSLNVERKGRSIGHIVEQIKIRK